MSSSFCSPRQDAFPAGLRVLVVDDDPTWLKILEKMLKKCKYEVTTCGLATEALKLLREKKDGYDIVISDVNMPDMDGFKLLEHVGLEMDLPVIMMSVDGETSRVMKGVQHGACNYLLKPISMKELKNIWQHVFKKRIHEVREIENQECLEGNFLKRNALDQTEDCSWFFAGDDTNLVKKRKDLDNKQDERDFGDPSSSKKARVVWSVDLHQKFVTAVNHIGIEKVGPKKILDLMNVPWLTRENVASHLQKYRLYLSRLQKENDQKSSFTAMKHLDSDSSSKGTAGSLDHKKSVNLGQSHERNLKGITPEPLKELPKKAHTVNIPDPKKPRRSTFFKGLDRTFRTQEYEPRLEGFDRTLPEHYSWNGAAKIPLKQDGKSLLHLEDSFNQLPLHGEQHHTQVDIPQLRSISSNTPTCQDAQIAACSDVDYMRDYLSSLMNPIPIQGISSAQSKSHVIDQQALEQLSAAASGGKAQGCNLSGVPDDIMGYQQRNFLLGNASTSTPMDQNIQCPLLQGDFSTMNYGLHNLDLSEYFDPGLMCEAPVNLSDTLRFDYECPYEQAGYSWIDQGLFIV